MRRIMATLMVMVMLLTLVLSVPVSAAEGEEPITLTVFRGDPGDQPAGSDIAVGTFIHSAPPVNP